MRAPRPLITAWLLALSACVGSIPAGAPEPAPAAAPVSPPRSPLAPGAPGAPAQTTSSDGGGPPAVTPALECRTPIPLAAPARRLTRVEYNNTVRDLLGDTTRPADGFPAEVGSTAFANDATALDFSRLLMEQYFAAARSLAARAAADARTFASVLGCDPATVGETACATTFVQGFGLRAYRRPLDAGERDRLLAVYRSARADGDFRAAITTVMRTMLQAPQFLYRAEAGQVVDGRADLRKLDGYEVASRLSYLMWASMPDGALFTAAQSGRLGTRVEVMAQARRMLGDPRARAVVTLFHTLAFRTGGIESVNKDKAVYPKWVPGTGALLAEETSRVLDDAVWGGPGDLKTLLTGAATFLNADLARYYGVSGPRGAAFEKVTLDPARTAGFLTRAGPLALLTPGNETNPVRRGEFLRSHLLCAPPPSPPPGLNVVPPKPTADQTTRESFAAHSKDPSCAGCHKLMDPLGFAFEGFDGAGLPRSTDHGKPVDTRGTLSGTDVDGPFEGAIDLMKRLGGSADVRRCYVAHWYSYGYGRGTTDRDACALAGLDDAFVQAGGKVTELLLALTQIEGFLYKEADR